jgi:hypothetical protein
MIRLTWVEIGLATAPGRYDSRYGVIEVTSDDVWIRLAHSARSGLRLKRARKKTSARRFTAAGYFGECRSP